MKVRRFFLMTLFIIISGKTFPCLNGESLILKNGYFLYEDMKGSVPYGHSFDIENGFKKELKELDSLYIVTKDLDYLSDKGLLLILLKQYEKAIKLYHEIEKIEPGRYATASNMGTAYELMGNNEAALKWIRRSIEIESAAHKNSEWIHVNILEAKIKGDTFITSAFLLNTNFGTNDLPVSTLKKDDLRKLSDELYFQLNERISFVKPKEKIVAQLLFELGNIAFLLEEYDDAIADYEMAKKYGFLSTLLVKRLKESEKITAGKPGIDKALGTMKKKLENFLIIALAGVLILIVSIVVIKRRKK